MTQTETTSEAVALARTPLLDQAAAFRAEASAAVPGRVAALIDARVAQLLRLDAAPASLPDDLDPGEQVVVDLVEQFMVDVHGVTDERFARLGAHFTAAETVAIMFHLALVDGFAKLARVSGDDELAVTP